MVASLQVLAALGQHHYVLEVQGAWHVGQVVDDVGDGLGEEEIEPAVILLN